MFIVTPEVLPSVTNPNGVTQNPYAGSNVIQMNPSGSCACKGGGHEHAGVSLFGVILLSIAVSVAVNMVMYGGDFE